MSQAALDPLAASDVAEIRQLLARFPHAFDEADGAALSLVFSTDAEIRLTGGAGSVKSGLREIQDFAAAVRGTVDHHTLDSVVFRGPDGSVRARSRYLALLPDQSVHNGDYLDLLVRTADGWRISLRISVPRIPRGDVQALSADLVEAWLPR